MYTTISLSTVHLPTSGNRISKLITAVYKVNRQDKTRQGEQSQAFGCSAHFRDVQMPVEVKSEFIYDP